MNEILQFAAVLAVFVVIAVVWVFVIYLPGRTPEDWRDKRTDRKPKNTKLP